MTKQSTEAIKKATENLKGLTKAKKDKGLFLVTTVADDDNISIRTAGHFDNPDDFRHAFIDILNSEHNLAHAMGHIVAELNEDAFNAFQSGLEAGLDIDNDILESELVGQVALLRTSHQMSDDDYIKQLDMMKKDMRDEGVPEKDIKNLIKNFDDQVTAAMAEIKEMFAEKDDN